VSEPSDIRAFLLVEALLDGRQAEGVDGAVFEARLARQQVVAQTPHRREGDGAASVPGPPQPREGRLARHQAPDARGVAEELVEALGDEVGVMQREIERGGAVTLRDQSRR